MAILVALPESVLLCVLSLLDYKDLLNVAFTCRVLQGLALSDCLWMRLCEPWKEDVNLEKWRAGVDSARNLFRCLSSLSNLVGHWSALQLAPRGGLLFVTWGHLSVLAYQVVIWQTGDVTMQHLFDVAALPNSRKTKIFTTCLTPAGRRGLSLSGALVRPSCSDDEFFLELAEYCEAMIHNMPDPLSNADMTSFLIDYSKGITFPALQLSHILRSLDTSFGRSLDTSFGIGQYLDDDEDEDCVFIDGNHQVLHITSERDIKGSLYRRLIVKEPCEGDAFAGLWAGLYGLHGVEIMNVSYTKQEIVATKVLGDPNVPCNQITFKAKIETGRSDIPPRYQAIMNAEYRAGVSPFKIVKLYDGLGQIADMDFENPRWVPGKLLVDENNVIAFLWEYDNFVVRYRRLHLPSVSECQKESLLDSIM